MSEETMSIEAAIPGERPLTSGEDALRESLQHDFATPLNGAVPMSRRRPLWHFAGLWTTFTTGFAYVFLGIQMYDGGHGLPVTIGITLLGSAMYVCYALFAAYLGSRSGYTHGLLTRSIFGRAGTLLVGVIVVLASLGAAGFQAGLLAQGLGAIFHWNSVETLSLVLGFVMIFNNLFGFSGISTWARYIVTPLAIVWIGYLVVKTMITSPHVLGTAPHMVTLPLWAAVGGIVGNAMWGNEPDVWRYGKPKFFWPVPAFAFAFFWSLMFVVGGWLVGALAHSNDFNAQVHTLVNASVFGLAPLAVIMIVVTQTATNDGNYYEGINVVQNLLGATRRWRRIYSCLICGALGLFFAWLVNYQFVNGWLKVSGFLAVSIPCATTIMVVDYFLLPRMFRISRRHDSVPQWREMKATNLPALIALVISVLYGSYAIALFPASIESPSTYLGPASLESWVMAAVLYIIGVAITLRLPGGAQRLGMMRVRDAEEVPVPEVAP
jgi:purine-cytosine permease-like protein